MIIYIACGIVAIVAFYLYFKKKTRYGVNNVDGVINYPFLGSTPLLPTENRFLNSFFIGEGEKRNYKTWGIGLGSPTIMTSDARDVEYILKKRFENYVKGPVFQDNFFDLLGTGIFNADGDTWKFHRKAASHLFATKRLREYQDQIFTRDAKLFAEILENRAKSGEEILLQNLTSALTFDSFCSLAFGISVSSLKSAGETGEKQEFFVAFDQAQQVANGRFVTLSLFWKLKKLFNIGEEKQMKYDLLKLHETVDKVVDDRISSKESLNERGDLLSSYIVFAQNNGLGKLEKDSFRDLVLNFLLAGRDTTSALISNFFRCTAFHPEVYDKCYEEMEILLKNSENNEITNDVLKNAKYLEAALLETLRLFPSVPADVKMALEEDVLPSGAQVKPGDNVVYQILLVQSNPAYWGNDSKEFDPSRWIEKRGVAFEDSSKLNYYFPAFNAGPRLCLGKNMALMEAKNCVLHVLQKKIRFKLDKDDKEFRNFKLMSHAPVFTFNDGLKGTVEISN